MAEGAMGHDGVLRVAGLSSVVPFFFILFNFLLLFFLLLLFICTYFFCGFLSILIDGIYGDWRYSDRGSGKGIDSDILLDFTKGRRWWEGGTVMSFLLLLWLCCDKEVHF